METKFLCVCGHLNNDPSNGHQTRILEPGLTDEICWGCAYEDKPRNQWYHKFKQDNLKYLEKKYEALHK